MFEVSDDVHMRRRRRRRRRHSPGRRPLTTPPPAAAQALLERLATDPGVVGIMRDRGWQVGTLTEMLPDGKVRREKIYINIHIYI